MYVDRRSFPTFPDAYFSAPYSFGPKSFPMLTSRLMFETRCTLVCYLNQRYEWRGTEVGLPGKRPQNKQ